VKNEQGFLTITTLQHLITLYEQEGYLYEALQVAEIAAQFNQQMTALGVVACLAFTRCRAMVITPGSVIRGTFDKAFDYQTVGNVLYGLPGGPLIPGCKPPRVPTLDRDEGPIRSVSRHDLLAADIIITNFHSLGNGEDQDDLLAKLSPADIDLIVVDEAHIAAAESYQRTFHHFNGVRTLLMSACFQRLDGKPIDAYVVYRYRLIDSIADGNAKMLCSRSYKTSASLHASQPSPTPLSARSCVL
jgi:hypothetical protein